MSTNTIVTRTAAGFAAALLACTALPASAAMFMVDFTQLNNSGVAGTGMLDYDEDGQTLTVTINATGLAEGAHIGHIHGRFDGSGNPIDSVSPSPTADTDGDGFVEIGEGAVFYGPIILPLSGIGSVDASGILNYSQTFDLTDASIFGAGFSASDLLPLSFREIVLHGGPVPLGTGAGTSGILDGTQGAYVVGLPVASGEITAAVPEPATWAMMLLGFFGIGGMMRARRGAVRSLRLGYGF